MLDGVALGDDPTLPPRISIHGSTLMRENKSVVPLGGNYVFKAQPYFPDLEVVASDAEYMAAGARAAKYTPSDNRTVVPVVRLGAMLEAFMPDSAGVVDTDWQSRLEATVQAFGEQGVYVFLDIHQDGLASTNGGEGLPWWLTAKMQETAASVPQCFTCTSATSYLVSPKHPLKVEVPGAFAYIMHKFGVKIPTVKVANSTDPWLAYSVNGSAGDPRRMNVGNVNMRINNNDQAWGAGTLVLSAQVQNTAWRFFRAHLYKDEKAMFFDHYMTFVRYLCSVWERFSNVIAVELFNEPPLGGIPDLVAMLRARSDLFSFYAAVMQELESDPVPTRAPLAMEDIFGTALNIVWQSVTRITHVDGISSGARKTFQRWAGRGQLLISFHWYSGVNTEDSLKAYIQEAKHLAAFVGSPPVWLSEYFGDENETATFLAVASELGCNAVTYWHYANTDYTKTSGWYKYPPEVVAKGGPMDSTGSINWEAWSLYEQTVADGTYWGAAVTGANGAKMHILKNLPQVIRPAMLSPTVANGGANESAIYE